MAFLRPSWASETQSTTPAEAASEQAAQELAREGLRLRLADVDAEHLAAAALVTP